MGTCHHLTLIPKLAYVVHMTKRTVVSESGNLLRPSEAYASLGISLRTLDRWQSKGYIVPVRLPSGRRRFAASDVDKLKAVAK